MQAIIFLMVFLLVPAAAHAQRPDWTAAGLPQTLVVCTRSGDTANVRSGAGTSHPVVASLANGSQARVMEEARFPGRWSWFRILHTHPDLPSQMVDGWVHGTLLAPGCAVAHDPVVAGSRGSVIGGTDLGVVAAPDDDPGSVWLVEICTANGDTVNVRAGPGTQHRVLAALENGTGLRVRAGDPRDPRAWLRVELVDDLQGDVYGIALDGYVLSRLAITGMCPILHDPAVAGTPGSQVGGRSVTLGPWDPYHDLHLNNPGHPQSRRVLDVATPAYEAMLAREGHGEVSEGGSLYAREDAEEAERQRQTVPAPAAAVVPATQPQPAALAPVDVSRPPVCEARQLAPAERGVGHFILAGADGSPQVLWTELRPDVRLARVSPALAGPLPARGSEVGAGDPLLLRDQTLRHVAVWTGTVRTSSGHRDQALALVDPGGPAGGDVETRTPPPAALAVHAHRAGDGSLLLLMVKGFSDRSLVAVRSGRAGGWQVEEVQSGGSGTRIGHAFGASHPNGDLTAIWSEPFAPGASLARPHLYMATRQAASGRWGAPVRITATGSDRVSMTNGYAGAVGLGGEVLFWWSDVGAPLRAARIGPDGTARGPVLEPDGAHTLLAGGAAPSGEALFVLEHRRGSNSWVRIRDGEMSKTQPIEGLEMKRSAGEPQIEPARNGGFWLVQRGWGIDRILRFDGASAAWSPETRSDSRPPQGDARLERATSAGPAAAMPDGSLALATNLSHRSGGGHDILLQVCR